MNSHTNDIFGNAKQETCPKHGSYQSFYMLGKWTLCGKCAQEIVVELDKKQADKVLEDKRKRCLESAYIPELFAEAGLKNYEAELDEQIIILQSIKEYINRFKFDRKTAGNLLLLGHTGNGKSHLACAILRTLAYAMHRTRYITSAGFVDEIMGTWGDKSKSARSLIQHYADYDLLVIDELGLHDSSKQAQEYLSLLIDARYLAKRPTICISNLEEAELEKVISARVFDRLAENSQFLAFNWESYRQRSRRSAA